MLSLENNGPAHFVQVVSSDYPEYEGARAMGQVVNNHLVLVAECRDGNTRRYKSTRIAFSSAYSHEDCGLCFCIRTRSGKVWVLS